MPPRNRKYRTPPETKPPAAVDPMTTPVAEMALSVRVINTLEEYDVIIAGDLLAKTYAELMAMKNFGDKTMADVRKAVAAVPLPVPAHWKRPAPPKKPPKPKLGRAAKQSYPKVW